MPQPKPPLSPTDKVALSALIVGALASGLPLVAVTRALILLFALGGGLFLCYHASWRTWRKWAAALAAIGAYVTVVLLLFDREAREANTVAPTTSALKWLLSRLASVPWDWVVASAAIAATAVWLVMRRRLQL